MAPGMNLGALRFAGKLSSQAVKIREAAATMTGLELAPRCPHLDGPICFDQQLHERIWKKLRNLYPDRQSLPKDTTHEQVFEVVLKSHDKGRLWNFLTKLAKQSNAEHGRAADPDERKQITVFVEEIFMYQGGLKKRIEEEQQQQSLQDWISKQDQKPGWQKASGTSLDQVRLKRRQAELDHEYSHCSTGPKRAHLTTLINPPLAPVSPAQASNATVLPEDQEYEKEHDIPVAMQSLSLAKSIKNSFCPYNTSQPAPIPRRSPRGLNMNLSSVQALRTDGVREDKIDADLRTARSSRPTTATTVMTDQGSWATDIPSAAPSSMGLIKEDSTVKAEDGEVRQVQESNAVSRPVQRNGIRGRNPSMRIHDSSHRKNLFGAQGPSWWSLRLK